MQLLRCVYLKVQYLRRGGYFPGKHAIFAKEILFLKAVRTGTLFPQANCPFIAEHIANKRKAVFLNKCCFLCSGCGKNATIISLFTFATHDTGPSNRERAASARRTSSQRAIAPRHDDMSPSYCQAAKSKERPRAGIQEITQSCENVLQSVFLCHNASLRRAFVDR